MEGLAVAKFVDKDKSQLYLLPVDMRDWLPEDDLAHFVLEAVERVPMRLFHVNERGTGSAQYHPRMMLALLIYCYANGIFGSRRIERATYHDIGVRYVASNTHPDHDTICAFRRNNFEAVAETFEQVLLLAKELKLLRVGTVSVDGTKVDANANKHKNIRYDRAQALRAQLRVEIEELLERAESEDAQEVADSQALPEEMARREELKSKLDEACAELERRAKTAADAGQADHDRKVASRERRRGRRKGPRIKPPREEPEEGRQINLTDGDSALMRKSKRHKYRQAFNAQAVVDAEGSQLVLGARVSNNASDRRELVADVDKVPPGVGAPARVLADSGYATGSEVEELEGRGTEVMVSTEAERRRRGHDFRPPVASRPGPAVRAEWIAAMRAKMAQPEERARYRLRRQTVEPVFGIVKQAMGFRQFLLRGLDKVQGEWVLVMLGYNCKRLHPVACRRP